MRIITLKADDVVVGQKSLKQFITETNGFLKKLMDGEHTTGSGTAASGGYIGIDVVLEASAWKDGSITVKNDKIKSDSLVIMTCPAGTADAVMKSIAIANISSSAQADGEITLTANGTVPDKDVAITLAVFQKAV